MLEGGWGQPTYVFVQITHPPNSSQDLLLSPPPTTTLIILKYNRVLPLNQIQIFLSTHIKHLLAFKFRQQVFENLQFHTFFDWEGDQISDYCHPLTSFFTTVNTTMSIHRTTCSSRTPVLIPVKNFLFSW